MKLYNTIFSSINSLRFYLFEKLKYELIKNKKQKLLKKENPLISILLPTFNRSKILKKRAIKTVLNQSYRNFELVIVDDGSTDDTKKVVNKIKDKRIVYFNIERFKNRYPNKVENHWFVGPVIALNKALSLVKGDWIARIDDDDIWTKDHLKDLLKKVVKDKSEFVSSDYLEIRNKIKKTIRPTIKDKKLGLGRIGGTQTWLYAAYLNFFKYNINSWRKKINKVNDLDIQERFVKVGIKTTYLKKVTCIIKPRDKENEVGLKAYLIKSKEILKKFN